MNFRLNERMKQSMNQRIIGSKMILGERHSQRSHSTKDLFVAMAKKQDE